MKKQIHSLLLSVVSNRLIRYATKRFKRGVYFNALIFILVGYAQIVNASVFTPGSVELAVNLKLLDFWDDDLQNYQMEQSRAICYMALIVHQDSTTVSPSGILVRNRFLEQIRSLLTPGREPNANGSLSGWTHSAIANAFLLAKNTPSVWSRLTAGEKNKIDWLMKAMAIAGHFCFDDENDFRTGLGNEGNFYKLSNPNYREGYVAVVIAASLYFGPDSLNKIYLAFNYNEYMDQFGLSKLNFPNLLLRWGKYAWGPVLESGGNDSKGGHGAGIRNTFTYQEVGLSNPFGIFKKLADYMYGTDYTGYAWTESSKVIDGLTVTGVVYSRTLNNGTSPYLGQPGMCFEFHATDGSGSGTKPRSDIVYVAEGWGMSVCTRATLKALGYWTGPHADIMDVESRMFVGSEDFLYKAQKGFSGYSKGATIADKYEADLAYTGLVYTKDIWLMFLKGTPPTGILPIEGAGEGSIKLYPNPLNKNGQLTIILNSVTGSQTNVCIADLQGRIVYKNNFLVKDDPIIITTNSIPQGIYILSVSNNSSRFTDRLIIQ